jgi:hypothetical protein
MAEMSKFAYYKFESKSDGSVIPQNELKEVLRGRYTRAVDSAPKMYRPQWDSKQNDVIYTPPVFATRQ